MENLIFDTLSTAGLPCGKHHQQDFSTRGGRNVPNVKGPSPKGQPQHEFEP